MSIDRFRKPKGIINSITQTTYWGWALIVPYMQTKGYHPYWKRTSYKFLKNQQIT